MIDSILNQLMEKFAQLKGLVLNNSITKEDAIQQSSKLIFAANVVLSSLNKEPDEITETKIQMIKDLKVNVLSFRDDFAEIYNDTEPQPELVEELKVHLPETIHTDSFEETASF